MVFLQWSIDSGSSYWIPGPLSVEIGFRILIVFEILVSLSCIPDSKAQEPDSHKKKFLRFPEFGFPYRGLNLSSGFLGVTFFLGPPTRFSGSGIRFYLKVWIQNRARFGIESRVRDWAKIYARMTGGIEEPRTLLCHKLVWKFPYHLPKLWSDRFTLVNGKEPCCRSLVVMAKEWYE